MDYQLTGKLAYVSAGAHGTGAAIADLLTEEGAEVIVADVDADGLRANGGRWRATVAADLATSEGVDAAVAEMLRAFERAPDILVIPRPDASTGYASPTTSRSCPTTQWRQWTRISRDVAVAVINHPESLAPPDNANF